MKKKETKNTYCLDDDFTDESWDGIALLIFHSVAPNYAFVDDLNHLYDLDLHRIDDLQLETDSTWPLFTHYDSLHQLHYYLVERPANGGAAAQLWTAGHKMLIVLGQQAAETVENIHREFCEASAPDDPSDIIASRHSALLDELRSNFTTTTIVDPSSTPPLKGKALREYNDLLDLTNSILDTLDIKYICDI